MTTEANDNGLWDRESLIRVQDFRAAEARATPADWARLVLTLLVIGLLFAAVRFGLGWAWDRWERRSITALQMEYMLLSHPDLERPATMLHAFARDRHDVLTRQLLEDYAEGAGSDELFQTATEYLVQFIQKRRQVIASASDTDMVNIARARVVAIAELAQRDEIACAGFNELIVDRATHLYDDDRERIAQIRAYLIKATHTGEGGRLSRNTDRLGPADRRAYEGALAAQRLTLAQRALRASPETLAAASPGDQCAVRVAEMRATASLPAAVTGRVLAYELVNGSTRPLD